MEHSNDSADMLDALNAEAESEYEPTGSITIKATKDMAERVLNALRGPPNEGPSFEHLLGPIFSALTTPSSPSPPASGNLRSRMHFSYQPSTEGDDTEVELRFAQFDKLTGDVRLAITVEASLPIDPTVEQVPAEPVDAPDAGL